MTKEQFEKLKKYESIFRTAIDSQYYRAMDSRFAADFVSICKDLNIHINTSCPSCVLRALQTLGKLYFNMKAQIPVQPANADSSVLLSNKKVVDNKTIAQAKKASQKTSKNKKKAK